MEFCPPGNHPLLIENKSKRWKPPPQAWLHLIAAQSFFYFLDEYWDTVWRREGGGGGSHVHKWHTWKRRGDFSFFFVGKWFSSQNWTKGVKNESTSSTWTLSHAITHALGGMGCLTLSTAVSLPRKGSDESGHYWRAEWTDRLSSQVPHSEQNKLHGADRGVTTRTQGDREISRSKIQGAGGKTEEARPLWEKHQLQQGLETYPPPPSLHPIRACVFFLHRQKSNFDSNMPLNLVKFTQFLRQWSSSCSVRV